MPRLAFVIILARLSFLIAGLFITLILWPAIRLTLKERYDKIVKKTGKGKIYGIRRLYDAKRALGVQD